MNKLTVTLITIVLAVGLTQARAQDAASGPTTKTLTAKISGTFATPVTGECAGAGFATQCSPSAMCVCATDSTATVSGSIAGKGAADMSFTIDQGNIVPTSGLPHFCEPLYGEALLTTTLKEAPLTETISILAVVCHVLTTAGKNTISGGFGIENGASNSAAGWGTVSGTFDNSSQTFALSLKGSITQ